MTQAIRPKWLPEEDDLLRQLYGKVPAKELSQKLKRPTKGIWNRAQHLGLAISLKAMAEERRKKELKIELTNMARHYDPFGRQLAIFCIKNVKTHLQKDD